MLPAMPTVSRRAFVISPVAAAGSLVASGLTLGLVSGCTDKPSPIPIDPDRVALLAAFERERSLLAQSLLWDGEAVPAAEVRAVLQTHVERLASTVSTPVTPTSTATPTLTGSSVVTEPSTLDLAREAGRVADEHTQSIPAAGAQTAQLLASLAASDAALAAYLRITRIPRSQK
jgi:hypothetical protein